MAQMVRPSERRAPVSPSDEASALSLSQLLAQERVIRFNVNLAVITKDVKATLFASQLLYWTQHGQAVIENGGWIFKTREQWEHETGLSRAEQERARSILLELGLVAEARVGSPARNCYRIIPEALGQALAHVMRREARQLSLFDLRTPAGETQVLLGRHLAYYCAFASLTESITNAVMLSKCLQLQQTVSKAQTERLKAKHTFVTEIPWDQDWFRLAPHQVQTETGLSPAQQKRSKQNLCQLNLLEEAQDRKGYGFVRVKVKALFGKLTDHLLGKLVSKHKETCDQGRGQNYSTSEKFGTVPKCSNTEKMFTVNNSAKMAQIIDIVKNSPSSSAQRSNPVGDFLHPSRRVFTPQLASFEGVRRRLFDPLYAHGRRITVTGLQQQLQTRPATASYPQPSKKSPTENIPVVVVSPADFSKNGSQKGQSSQTQNIELQHLQWPNQLDAIQKQACQKLLRGQAVPENRHQLLVDELAGFVDTGKVNNPVAYFSKLIRLDIESGPDGMVFSHAHEVAQIRDAKKAHEERTAHSIAALNAETTVQKTASQNSLTEVRDSLTPAINPSKLLADLRQKIGLPPAAPSARKSSQSEVKHDY
ncbi:MAG: hypothetical protein QM533_11525 [Cytophagales bacterium]|nr:hypothetical protein [Cytophagales bacterium]